MSREYEDVSPELGGRFVEHLRRTLVAELGVPILRDDRRIPSIDVLVPTERRRDVLELAVGQVTDAAWEAAIAQGSGRLPTTLTVVLDLEFGRDASLRVALSFERDTPTSYLDLLERRVDDRASLSRCKRRHRTAATPRSLGRRHKTT